MKKVDIWKYKYMKKVWAIEEFFCSYEGPLLEETVYTKELEAAPQSVEYTKVIEWATKELAALHGLEDYVNAITGM